MRSCIQATAVMSVAAIVAVGLSPAASARSIDAPVTYYATHGQGRLDIDAPAARNGKGRVSAFPAFGAIDALVWEPKDCSTANVTCIDFVIFAIALPKSAALKSWSSGLWTFQPKGCIDNSTGHCERSVYEYRHQSNGRRGTFGYSTKRGLEFVQTGGSEGETDVSCSRQMSASFWTVRTNNEARRLIGERAGGPVTLPLARRA